jgi:hypothetical protein
MTEPESKDYSKMNIYQKMNEITSMIGSVAKNLTVGSGNYSYKAVGEKDVLDAVKKHEKSVGVYSFPVGREELLSEIITSEGNDKIKVVLRIKTTYRFVNCDKPDEFLEMISYGDGVDSSDKSPGKAMTYSDKYALLKAYKIETGDDPDARVGDAPGDGKTKTGNKGGKTESTTVFLTKEQYDNYMKKASAEEIKKCLDTYKTDKLNMSKDYRSSLTGRMNYLNQEKKKTETKTETKKELKPETTSSYEDLI